MSHSANNNLYIAIYRLADYLTLLENYRAMQKELEPQVVDDFPDTPEENSEPNQTDSHGQDNGHDNQTDEAQIEEPSTSDQYVPAETHDETISQSNEDLTAANDKALTLAERRGKLQANVLDMDELPDPKTVTDEEIDEYFAVFDLPAFPPKKKRGKATIFNTEKEQEMMEYLKELDSLGFGRTMDEFQADIQFYYKNKVTQPSKKGCVFSKIPFPNLLFHLFLKKCNKPVWCSKLCL